jgi:hypothetical protein
MVKGGLRSAARCRATLLLATVAAAATGCGTTHRSAAPRLERSFDVHWLDHASSYRLLYTTRGIVFHGGRWSAHVVIRNDTGRQLYEAPWDPPSSRGTTWNGPALAFEGQNVLGSRQLILVPADTERPRSPYPLRPGQTWRGVVGGKVPAEPALPRGRPIWIRFQVYAVDRPWVPETSPAETIAWFTNRGIQL